MANSLIKSLLDSFTGGLINEVLLYVLLLLDWGLGTMYSQTCLKWKSMGLGKILHCDVFPQFVIISIGNSKRILLLWLNILNHY